MRRVDRCKYRNGRKRECHHHNQRRQFKVAANEAEQETVWMNIKKKRKKVKSSDLFFVILLMAFIWALIHFPVYLYTNICTHTYTHLHLQPSHILCCFTKLLIFLFCICVRLAAVGFFDFLSRCVIVANEWNKHNLNQKGMRARALDVFCESE